MAAIINRALMDVKGGNLATVQARDQAMAWFHISDFEAYCLALELDPQRIRDKAADYYRESIPDVLTSPKSTSPRPKSKRRVIVKARGKSPHNTHSRTANLPRK